ncbi:MAG: oxygen-independent coproporphyrinogen III oxidase [Bacteroidia bacterium]
MQSLIQKYNVQGPRYTSYPTVPYWNTIAPTQQEWINEVNKAFTSTNNTEGISIYIHLPFCESLCTYCGCNTRITVNHAVEEPYINALIKEWQMYLQIFQSKPNIKEIHLGGGTPTFFSAENLKKLISNIVATSNVSPNAEFSFEAHPNNTHLCHLKTMFDLGFKRISLGIQDFNEVVQDAINRKQSFEQVKNITQLAREVGYTSINYDLIYGLPFQTIDSVKDTVEKTIQLKPDRIAFYSYAHVPWLKPGQRKYSEKDLPSGDYKRALYELGREMFEKAAYVEIGMDHFALKTDSLYLAEKNGDLHRNFMGYTAGKTHLMIGLGVSSISDAWTAFAQNVKTVEEYYTRIEKNQLPIFKGHLLTSEDLILRQHILNIMCRLKTSWEQEELQCDAVYNAIEKLHEMQQDGLLLLNNKALVVTEKGRPFIRNICMAFDARLHRNQPQTKLFSQTV